MSSERLRRLHTAERRRAAATALGPISPGVARFVVTGGRFSMVDAIAHVLEATGPARVSVWSWTVAAFDVAALCALGRSGAIRSAVLVCDFYRAKWSRVDCDIGAHVDAWRGQFGPESVRLMQTHAKMATVLGDGLRVSLRGSMNLNDNQRVEVLDVTEGGPDVDLLERIEAGLPIVSPHASSQEVRTASKLVDTFTPEHARRVDPRIKVFRR